MMQGPILALDLARHYGWCSGEVGAPLSEVKVGHGVFGFAEKAATEDVFASALNELGALIKGHNVVVYEAPIPPIFMKGRTNMGTTRIAFGLAAITEAVSAQAQIEVREATVGDVRRHFIQTGKLKRDEAKREVWRRCKQLGLECKTSDESDAAALWHYMSALIDPRTAARSTPLFAGRS